MLVRFFGYLFLNCLNFLELNIVTYYSFSFCLSGVFQERFYMYYVDVFRRKERSLIRSLVPI